MMLKLFVILVFAAVVFGDSSSITSLLKTSTQKPTSTATAEPTTTATATAEPTTTATATAEPTTTATATAEPSTTATATAEPTTTATSTATAATSTTPKLTTTAATTATPKPTTTAATTTTPTNGTVKPSPTKSTTTPPTATPHPTTLPPSGNFSLRDDKTGNYCILAQFEASFTIELHFIVFNSSDNSSITWNKTWVEHIDSNNKTMRDDVKVTGDCGPKGTNASSSLVLSWPKEKPFYALTMDFRKSSDNKTWMVNKITFDVTLKNNSQLPSIPPGLAINASVLGTYNPPSSQLGGQVGGYYLCDSKTPLSLESNVDDITLTSRFENMHLEPFVNKPSALDFDKAKKECYGDNPTGKPTTPHDNDNDIVPIAVGCALAGLVLIVLIAYVIGRRKSHSGYEKV